MKYFLFLFAFVLTLSSILGSHCTVPKRCKCPPVMGNCKARMEKWYYNEKKGCCEMFIYGGCGGNDNRFDTRECCEDACRPQC